MRRISQLQFNAYCYARQPSADINSIEVSWFEAGNRKLLAIIIQDQFDFDYGYIILGRDSCKMFRWISGSVEFFNTIEKAEEKLKSVIEEYINDGKELYTQGDEKHRPNEILVPIVADEKLHPDFKTLINNPVFEAARNLIKEIVYTYVAPDRHYIREFQTQGFNARLWELFLYVYLYNTRFEFIHGNVAPDYHISIDGHECFIEAVTVNASEVYPNAKQPETLEDILALTDNYLPVKFGGALYSKLQEKYWEKEYVKGKPLIIAIHDFHMSGSMTWSQDGLREYLYGRRIRVIEREGKNKVVNVKIESHQWKNKTIPSNFFELPNCENISAVLFTNAATISKFNRMGKLAGLGSKDVKMIRRGKRYNPNDFHPIEFSIDVDSLEYEESWSDSLMMFHNPNALHPINPEWFHNISHTWLDKESGEFRGYFRPDDVLSSVTINVLVTE